MKCLFKDDKIIRIKDKEVEKYLRDGWFYTSKSKWKSAKNNSKKVEKND